MKKIISLLLLFSSLIYVTAVSAYSLTEKDIQIANRATNIIEEFIQKKWEYTRLPIIGKLEILRVERRNSWSERMYAIMGEVIKTLSTQESIISLTQELKNLYIKSNTGDGITNPEELLFYLRSYSVFNGNSEILFAKIGKPNIAGHLSLFLKSEKTNNKWELITGLQEPPRCDLNILYNIPTDILSCYDKNWNLVH